MQNFNIYTGWELEHFYSNISVFSEGYINFGKIGGVIFILCYSCIICLIFSALIKFANAKNPTLLLWIPLIFYQVVRLEADFTVAFNHMVKSSFFVCLLYALFWYVFRLRI